MSLAAEKFMMTISATEFWSRSPPPMRVPRVGFVSPTLTVGGVEMWFHSLVAHCPDMEWAGAAVPNHDVVDADLLGATQQLCPVEIGPRAVGNLLARCDVVLVWATSDSDEFERFQGTIVFVSHGASTWTRRVAKPWIALAEEFVAVSDLAARPFPPSMRPNVRRIPNGFELARLETSRSRTEIRRDWGLPEQTVAVGYCGRYSPEKNPLAAAKLVAQWPEAVAVYQCPPRTREIAAAEVGQVIPCQGVFPTGSVAEFYRGIDLLVMASHEEGFGLAIVEAWAAGVPVVATPVGIIPQAQAQFGSLVSPIPHRAGPACLLAAAQRAVSSDFRKVTRRAHDVAWQDFTARHMGQAWTAYLTSLFERQQNQPAAAS